MDRGCSRRGWGSRMSLNKARCENVSGVRLCERSFHLEAEPVTQSGMNGALPAQEDEHRD